MKPSLRQRLLIALGISVGILLSFNLFGQAPAPKLATTYTIHSQADYLQTIESIQTLATTLYDAHVKYPQLSYTHVYQGDGSLFGFNVTGVPQSNEADKISMCLMQLEVLGNAVNTMDQAFLPYSDNEKLDSRVSKKKASQPVLHEDVSVSALLTSGTNPNELMAANK